MGSGVGSRVIVPEKAYGALPEKDSRPLFRRVYIDWARGLAVLVMIQAHTMGAWTRAADKTTEAFGRLAFVGGFGAPLFLWLAGVALVLSATRIAAKTGSRDTAVEAICKRGLQIFILAFLFRLQAFILSPGGHPVTLFRVDILNIMGPAIAAAGLLWALSSSTSGRVVTYALVTASVALFTPAIRTAAFVDRLPVWLQWYIRPSGEHTTFTAFPWVGFVFAGAACGSLVAAVHREDQERRLNWVIAAIGAALLAIGWYTATRPAIHPGSSFWSSSPTWFAIRVGVMMMTLAALYGLGRISKGRGFIWSPLERLGRSSLFVYWVHVELVYGYASWLWRRSLPLWGSLLAFVAFTALMYAPVVLKDGLRSKAQSREVVTSRENLSFNVAL